MRLNQSVLVVVLSTVAPQVLRVVSLVFLLPYLREMTTLASSWIQLWASCSKGQLCGLRCFDMQATPGPLGCDPLFCQQLISVARIAATEQTVIGAQGRFVCWGIINKTPELVSFRESTFKVIFSSCSVDWCYRCSTKILFCSWDVWFEAQVHNYLFDVALILKLFLMP